MKRITREQIAAARLRAKQTLAGTYSAPPPVKVTRGARFNATMARRPRELALRSATGASIGPRGKR